MSERLLTRVHDEYKADAQQLGRQIAKRTS